MTVSLRKEDIRTGDVTIKDVKAFEARMNKSYESGTTIARSRASEFMKGLPPATAMSNRESGVTASNTCDRLILNLSGRDCTAPILAYHITADIAKADGRIIKRIWPKLSGHIRYMCGDEKDVHRHGATEAKRKAYAEAFTPLYNEIIGQYKEHIEVRMYMEYLDNVGRVWSKDKKTIESQDVAARANCLTLSKWIAAGQPCK